MEKALQPQNAHDIALCNKKKITLCTGTGGVKCSKYEAQGHQTHFT